MVSEKHMEWAARELGHGGGVQAWPDAVEFAVRLFTEFNPRFDEARFRAAVDKAAKGESR